MSEPFLGQIMQVGFTFVPQGWLQCTGQIIAIQQNTALFSLLGTLYGGNGQTTFAVPDARGRNFVGTGQGPGLSAYVPGQIGGGENATLNTTQLPAHNHTATFTPTGGGGAITATLGAKSGVVDGALKSTPASGDYLANTYDPLNGSSINIYAPADAAGTAVNIGGISVSGGVTGGAVNIGLTGNNQPVPILNPYLAITTIIAGQGIYPTRQ